MRFLFKLDKGDYELDWKMRGKSSVRGLIIKKNRIAMIYSGKYNYYKFPGGGIKLGENYLQTLKREVREESGLIVIEKSVKEFGWVYRIEKGHGKNIWEQKNYYYICDVENKILEQRLDNYEKEEKFRLEFVEPDCALKINRNKKHKASKFMMLERESKILEILVSEGYFNSEEKL